MKTDIVKAIFLIWAISLSQVAFSKKKIIIGVENIDYSPFYTTKKGQYEGFARKVFDLFCQKQGYKVEYKPLPINRLFHSLVHKKSEIDFKFPDHPHWRRDMKKDVSITYSEPVVGFTDGLLGTDETLKKKDITLIGTATGFTPWDYLDDIKSKRVKSIENSSLKGILRQVIAGRIQGAYINVDVGYFLLKGLSSDKKVVFLKNLPHTKSFYHLSTSTKPKVLEEFNSFLKKYKGHIKELAVKSGIKANKEPLTTTKP